jgi:RNA polymerase sigma-B factor
MPDGPVPSTHTEPDYSHAQTPSTEYSRAHTLNAQHDEHARALLARAAGLPPAQAKRLHDQVILSSRPLALSLARQYFGRGIDDDDLEQVAMLGLCKAVRGYRHLPGRTFAAYAVPTITGELKRHFRDCGWLVRPTRSLQEVGASVRSAIPTLAQRLQRQPSSADLADFLGVPADTIDQARLAEGLYQGWSLDISLGHATALLGETLPDTHDGFAPVEAALTVGPALARLTTRERTILRLRFAENLTQEQIGRTIGLSQMQVSRLLAEILATLRTVIDNPSGAAGSTRPARSVPAEVSSWS